MASTDSGARTSFTSGLVFDDATVPRRIRYRIPYRGIWYDIDGTLTGKGAGSWATAYFKHVDQPECTVDLNMYNGVLCPPTTTIRRIAFFGMRPDYFKFKNINIAKYDDLVMSALSAADKKTYLDTASNYSSVA